MTDTHNYNVTTKRRIQPNDELDTSQNISRRSGSFSAYGHSFSVSVSENDDTMDTPLPSSFRLGGSQISGFGAKQMTGAGSRNGSLGHSDQPVGDQASIAPPNLKNRTTEIDKLESQRKSVWKNAVAGAATGAVVVGGALAAAGAAATVEIGSLPGFAVGAIGGGVVGGILGFCGGAYRAYRYNRNLDREIQAAQANIDEQNRHFDQAIDNLRNSGMHIGQDEIENLSDFASEEWDALLSLERIGDESDRLKIRQAVISSVLTGKRAHAVKRVKDNLVEACGKNTLDFVLGARALEHSSPEKVDQFLRDFTHVIGSEQLWSTEDLHGDHIQEPYTRFRLGGHMMLQTMRRLQDPFYKLTQEDRWRINQALSPETVVSDEVPDAITDEKVGKYMSYDEKVQLADRMKETYFGAIRIDNDQAKQFEARYAKCTTLNERLDTIEHFMGLNNAKRDKHLVNNLKELAKAANFSDMERGVTRPARPTDVEEKRDAFLQQVRGGISARIDEEHPARGEFERHIQGLNTESYRASTIDHRDGHANVSRFFLWDAARLPINLIHDGKSINLKEIEKQKDAGNNGLQDWDAGDALLEFCDNDLTVATYLSQYAHQGIMQPMMAEFQNCVERDDGQSSFGFLSEDASNSSEIKIEKDEKGDFTLTFDDNKRLASINLPGTAPRSLDPFYNRCTSRLTIGLKKEDLKQGNGEFEFLEPPQFEAKFDIDRGSFEHTRALHDAEAVCEDNLSKRDQTNRFKAFMHKHTHVMLKDKFWNCNVRTTYPARMNEETFGTGLALGLVERAMRQDYVDEQTAQQLEKALHPYGEDYVNQGGVSKEEVLALAGQEVNEGMKSRLADMIYQQYAPPKVASSKSVGGRPELNLYHRPRDTLHAVFDDENASGDDKLAALYTAFDNVVFNGMPEPAKNLKDILTHWEDPKEEAM